MKDRYIMTIREVPTHRNKHAKEYSGVCIYCGNHYAKMNRHPEYYCSSKCVKDKLREKYNKVKSIVIDGRVNINVSIHKR
jgi:hypothetical protein